MKRQKKNAFWIALAAPGIIWLVLLFIVPFYAVLAIAMGKLNELYESPVAVWNPLQWSSSNVIDVARDLVGSASFAGPIGAWAVAGIGLFVVVVGFAAVRAWLSRH